MRGRKPKAPELRALDGDTRHLGGRVHLRAVASSPRPAGPVRPPPGISPEARAVWRRLAPQLEESRILRATDALVFAELCQVAADLSAAQHEIRRDGMLIVVETESPTGAITTVRRRHPLLGQLNVLRRQLASLASEFGLTAAARSRVKADDGGEAASRAQRLRERQSERRASRASASCAAPERRA